MSKPSTLSRVAASTLALVLTFGLAIAQDISGGAGVLLASADVEAKLGKGIFTPAQNRPHAAKTLEKKIIVRSVRAAHTTRQTTAGNRQTTGNSGTSGNSTGGAKPITDVGGPVLGGPARHVLDAAGYNKQGDDLFDAGQYDKAADSYQQAIKM